MHIETFFDEATSTFTYVLVDLETKRCAVIDSVLDYDQFAARTDTRSADEVIEYIEENGFSTDWILETHVHADHITAAHYLQEKLGGKIAMSARITDVLKTWVPIFNNENDTPLSGEQFDHLFEEGEVFNVGNLSLTVWHTPGHTPACASYLVNDAIFVGDTMFAPHLGTARCDFPGGSAAQLYETMQRFYSLPNDTKVYIGHDYPQPGEQPQPVITIAEAKEKNIQCKPDTSLDEYVAVREARDAKLAVPKLLFPALQANLRSGQFGQEDNNGQQFIKIPVNKI